ncbi:MAG: dihydroorotate dehydrogenase electron transfer subunit [Candidatus Cloacimonetes bacterium]|nr:dihydroorotate dehydrogenase electron transfer subunit [Candidatus Cloacimonadota bacterium]
MKSKRLILPINRIVRECRDVNTYFFSHQLEAKPGQFVMVTDYEGGEKPFSLADSTTAEFAITVKRVGQFTSRLFQKKAGEYLALRGPYGSSFFICPHRVLLVGGGYGTPPLYFLTRKLLEAGSEVIVVNGARSGDDLIFCEKFRALEVNYHNITQSGCLDRKGTAVDLARELMNTIKFDFIYAAGPEPMLKALQEIVKDTEYQFLMERYMKCAIGICGSCTMDPLGIRLCVEGPVLSRLQIEQLSEFGHYHRDATGARIYFNNGQGFHD